MAWCGTGFWFNAALDDQALCPPSPLRPASRPSPERTTVLPRGSVGPPTFGIPTAEPQLLSTGSICHRGADEVTRTFHVRSREGPALANVQGRSWVASRAAAFVVVVDASKLVEALKFEFPFWPWKCCRRHWRQVKGILRPWAQGVHPAHGPAQGRTGGLTDQATWSGFSKAGRWNRGSPPRPGDRSTTCRGAGETACFVNIKPTRCCGGNQRRPAGGCGIWRKQLSRNRNRLHGCAPLAACAGGDDHGRARASRAARLKLSGCVWPQKGAPRYTGRPRKSAVPEWAGCGWGQPRIITHRLRSNPPEKMAPHGESVGQGFRSRST